MSRRRLMNCGDKLDLIIDKIKEMKQTRNHSFCYGLDSEYPEYFKDSKWYDFKDDMIEVSRELPDITIMLEYQYFEDGVDLRVYKFLNGEFKRYDGEIVFKAHDGSLL